MVKQEKIGLILHNRKTRKSFLPADPKPQLGAAARHNASLSEDYLTKAAFFSKRRPNDGTLGSM